MKKIILFLFFYNSLIVFSQNKNFNFIISVDNNLSHVYAEKFILHFENDKSETISINFFQGRLSILEKDYEKLISKKLKRIDLFMSYIEVCGDNIVNYNYELEDFKMPWLVEDSYFILYIYNTNKKEYNKIYSPLPGKKFTYEYDWNGSSMRRVQKKLTREQRKCN